MCGIAGLVGATNSIFAENAVRQMIGVLAHRGPDSQGIEGWVNAVLGHRRLAIFDLSEAGHQPMVSADRSVGLVFNGAIYNYRELRKELIAFGYEFFSNTDTEVLIHGYRQWGLDRLVSKLRGMFAFGLWDNTRQKLYLVRDRLGVKPLIFAVHNRTIAFASTVRALRVAGFAQDLDANAVLCFLKFGFIADDCSIFRGVFKAPPASIVEWSDGAMKTREYWTPPMPNGSLAPSFEDTVEETEHLFLRSVEIRLRADVPVAVLLSGGIDSSLICWAVTKLGGNVTAYTVGTPGDPWDETAEATQTASKLGIRHHVLEMTDHGTPDIEELLLAYAEPFASASALGMLKISRAVASSAKVLLTGDGGDDVFLGYPRHRHLWIANKLAHFLPSSLRKLWLVSRSAFPRTGPLRRAASLLDYTAGGFKAYIGNSKRLSLYKAKGLFGDRLLSLPLDDSNMVSSSTGENQFLTDLLNYERKTYFVGEYMTKVDGATMRYGLEARSPFLDHCLWEFASSLPFDLRLHQGRLKSVLRELARRRIGIEVARRRKHGFAIPVHRWIAGRWRRQVEEAFHESILHAEGWIRMDAALSQLELAKRQGWAQQELWYIFVLESWLRHEENTRSRAQESTLT